MGKARTSNSFNDYIWLLGSYSKSVLKFEYTSFFHLIKYKIAIFMCKVYHKMLPLTIMKLFTNYNLGRDLHL